MFQKNVEKLLQSYNNSAKSINYNSEIETNCLEKRSKKHFTTHVLITVIL